MNKNTLLHLRLFTRVHGVFTYRAGMLAFRFAGAVKSDCRPCDAAKIGWVEGRTAPPTAAKICWVEGGTAPATALLAAAPPAPLGSAQ